VNILVVGSGSQIGCSLVRLFESRGVSFSGLETPVGMSYQELAKKIKDCGATILVNVEHVDGLYTEGLTQKELEKIHIYTLENLARAAELAGVPYLQLSDYRVFSGQTDRPYCENDEPHARTLYGMTRWQGELVVQRFTSDYVILRIGSLFLDQGHNLLTELLLNWEKGAGLQHPSWIQFAPTPVTDIARVILAIVRQLDCGAEAWGIYHYCSADIASPYDFAEVLLAARGQYVEDQSAIELEAMELPKDRRKNRRGSESVENAVLNCEKIRDTFGIRQRPWRGELTRMVGEIYSDNRLEKLAEKTAAENI
jgi:dTDP-4-dehydrorhamnose reductase